MVSDDVEFTAGEYVEVRGTRAEASFCMQCIGTIDVSSIEEVAPPQDSGDGDQAGMTLEGRVARGAECYRLKTPDGDTWSLTSSNADFTEGEYVEVSGRKADMSVCIQGIGTLQVSSIDEVQPRGDAMTGRRQHGAGRCSGCRPRRSVRRRHRSEPA